MSTILITGGSGMIGSAISKKLVEQSHQVIILTRSLPDESARQAGVSYALWNLDEGRIDDEALAQADFIIHLAGAGVADKRWTGKRKKEIVNSRVASGNLIAQSLASKPNKVKAVISASAIGWYGPDPIIPNPLPFIESDPSHNSFLGNTCKEWEQSIQQVKASGQRLVILRTGIVLSRTGGALSEFKKPFRFGVGTILGDGKQVISWIHIDDLVKMYVRAISDEYMEGIYNAVSPQPVSNREFMVTLAKSMKRKVVFINVPRFALKFALGEMSVEVLKSATVSADKFLGENLPYSFPSLAPALDDLVN